MSKESKDMSEQTDFADWPVWHDWAPELHITDVPTFDIEQMAKRTKAREACGKLVYGGEWHVRKHALEMLQMMTDDEQRELARALCGASVARQGRHKRMAALLEKEYLVEELYRYH